MILNDKQIIEKDIVKYTSEKPKKIDGFSISGGVTSFGFDAHLGRSFYINKDRNYGLCDPLNKDSIDQNFTQVSFKVDENGMEYFEIPPKTFALGYTMEYFEMPENCMSQCLGKSTYCRVGVFVNVSPIEPDFKGQITIEFYNALNCPVKLYAGQGICQFQFFEGERPLVTYKDKNGKYQGQVGVNFAK